MAKTYVLGPYVSPRCLFLRKKTTSECLYVLEKTTIHYTYTCSKDKVQEMMHSSLISENKVLRPGA